MFMQRYVETDITKRLGRNKSAISREINSHLIEGDIVRKIVLSKKHFK